MTFQYCSDLHLEFLQEGSEIKFSRWIQFKIKPSAPFLILAGDIGHPHRRYYKYLLEWCSQHFVYTFVVTGNHEYYTTERNKSSMSQTDDRIRELCKAYNNVFFLQKDKVEFEYEGMTYVVLGCTLWAPIPPEYQNQMNYLMNDYNYILDWSPKQSDAMHVNHMNWLYNELEMIHDEWLKISSEPKLTGKNPELVSKFNTKVVVVTHHAPSGALNVKRTVPCGYFGEYEQIIGSYVHAWVSGHTHENHSLKTKGGTLLLSNCIGYSGEKTDYLLNATF